MGTTRIALVEDDPGTARRFADAIATCPDLNLLHRMDSVRSALAWLRGNSPDVLLVDLGLPDGSGLEVIRYAKANCRGCDIMVVSIFGDDMKVLDSIEAGASGYLLKDGSETELSRHIQELRAGGSPMTPVIARKILRRLHLPASTPSKPAATQVVESLTQREAEVLKLIARGYSYAEIGERIGVARNTVKTHIASIYGKLAVGSRGEAVYEANRRGVLPPDALE
jgi:DNA-binding NarL/FixJ family response regulator